MFEDATYNLDSEIKRGLSPKKQCHGFNIFSAWFLSTCWKFIGMSFISIAAENS